MTRTMPCVRSVSRIDNVFEKEVPLRPNPMLCGDGADMCTMGSQLSSDDGAITSVVSVGFRESAWTKSSHHMYSRSGSGYGTPE